SIRFDVLIDANNAKRAPPPQPPKRTQPAAAAAAAPAGNLRLHAGRRPAPPPRSGSPRPQSRNLNAMLEKGAIAALGPAGAAGGAGAGVAGAVVAEAAGARGAPKDNSPSKELYRQSRDIRGDLISPTAQQKDE